MQDKNVQTKLHVVPLISVPVELKPGLDAPNRAGLLVRVDQGQLGDLMRAVNCAGNC